MTLFSFDKTKVLCRVIVAIGTCILLYGLWQYVPRGFSSETPEHIYWEIMSKRIAYPLCGLILIVIGNMLLRIINATMVELDVLRYEIIEIKKELENTCRD